MLAVLMLFHYIYYILDLYTLCLSSFGGEAGGEEEARGASGLQSAWSPSISVPSVCLTVRRFFERATLLVERALGQDASEILGF